MSKSGLLFSYATSLEQVESAWQLVYHRYLQEGLIDSNPFLIHTTPEAIGPHTCVIQGVIENEVIHTLSLFLDNPNGLSLDSVYGSYLDQLRKNERTIMEVGMLANKYTASIPTLMQMMRWGIYYALYSKVSDIVIGVHPRHRKFYERWYGFEVYASETNYLLVKNNPVILLRLRLAGMNKELRGIRDVYMHPINLDRFTNRFDFNNDTLADSRIENFLNSRVDKVYK